MINSVLVNTIVNAKIIKIAKKYILASFNEMVDLCHILNINDYILKNLSNFFTINKHYDFF